MVVLQGGLLIFWSIAAVEGTQVPTARIVIISLFLKICRVFEVASRSTVLVSMTALQQDQPSPASISLPFSLPQTEVPLFVIFTHSSSNSNLLIHTLIISGEQGMMWAGDLHQSQLAEVGVDVDLV